MTVCRYWQQGNCRFGNSCRFEHPDGGNRNQPANRFGALAGGTAGGAGGGGQSALDKYRISIDTIEADLKSEAPQWILSAYAPGRDAPEQLFGGYPREQSFEEMRLHYLTGKAAGTEQQALAQAQELYQNAQQQMQNALRNVREAANFIVEAENKHPNRHDICRQGTQGQPFGEFAVGKRPKTNVPAATNANPFSTGANNQTSAFGAGAAAAGGTATGSAFGQPSALGSRPNPFGQPSQAAPAFGQPSKPAQAASPFGQSSQQQPSAFGQPSQPGSAFGKPAFGQPSQPAAQGSTFGQPSQPAAQGSAFGQPSQLGAKPSPFGAPSFGQPSLPAAQSSAFGQPSQPAAQGSAFGQPSQLGQKPNPFGATSTTTASPFGAASNTTNNAPSPFGQPAATQGTAAAPSPFGSAPSNQGQAKPSPFGQPSQPSSGFGQSTTPAANPFASGTTGASQGTSNPSPFGQQPAQQSAFGSNQTQQQQPNGTFGQPSKASNPFGQSAPSNASAFGQQQANNAGQAPAQAQAGGATSNNPYPPDNTRRHPPIESYSAKGMDGNLTMFRDKPVTYKDGKPGIRQFDGTWQRIFFPAGPPAFNKDTALPQEEYDEQTRARWAAFAETGLFADGVMPELPPPRDCTLWNF